MRPIQPFSREATRAYNDAAIATFTPERYARGRAPSNADPAPVFIVGMPRSGTTLCEQILAAHAQAHGAGERSALGRLAWRLGAGETRGAIVRIAALDQGALDAAAAAYLKELRALAPDKTRIVDKMPGNYLYVWLIALLVPGAKIIHCVRDPARHRPFDLHLPLSRRARLRPRSRGSRLDDRRAGPADEALEGGAADADPDAAARRLGRDFDATLARVLAHVDLPPDPACARFHEADSRVRTVSRSQVEQPVNARGLGRWRCHAARSAP